MKMIYVLITYVRDREMTQKRLLEIEGIGGNDHTIIAIDVATKITPDNEVYAMVNDGICSIAIGGITLKIPTEVCLKIHEEVKNALNLERLIKNHRGNRIVEGVL